jgi:antitoxin HicB
MRKEISRHLRVQYPVLLHQVKEGNRTLYVAEYPDLPGCMSHGATANEALKNAEGAKRLWIRSRLEDRQPIPEPTEVVDFSGKFLVRMPKVLHRGLVQQAAQHGVSLNQYAVARLAETAAVDQIRAELQKEFSELRAQIEQLGRENRKLMSVLSQFAYFRQTIVNEAIVPRAISDAQVVPDAADRESASTAAPHPALAGAGIRR